jgi:aromatic ring-opening dioxygenase LigB subunit
MGTIVAAMATSHAFTFMNPSGWDEFRTRNRESLRRRTGMEPPPHAQIDKETLEANQTRHLRITQAHDALRVQLADARPSALVIIGDDQNENFTTMLPQIAVYVGAPGKTLRTGGHFARSSRAYPIHHDLAAAICDRAVGEGFDITSITEFTPNELKSHAHVQVLEAIAGDLDIPLVLIFVNAIHHPTIEPGRCYALGEMIARAVAGRPAHERVAICASGGLSHFTAGYPWKIYGGPFTYGDISEDFDRRAVELIERGEGRELSHLSGADLLKHGEVEMRAWITLLGTVGNTIPRFTVYEPFYRALMGMAVVSWPGNAQRPAHNGIADG